MSWEKTNLSLADVLEQLVNGYNYTKKLMFGCPVYFVNDNMWTGVKGGVVFLRLSEGDRGAIHFHQRLKRKNNLYNAHYTCYYIPIGGI